MKNSLKSETFIMLRRVRPPENLPGAVFVAVYSSPS
jgi:hypothetical protein